MAAAAQAERKEALAAKQKALALKRKDALAQKQKLKEPVSPPDRPLFPSLRHPHRDFITLYQVFENCEKYRAE